MRSSAVVIQKVQAVVLDRDPPELAEHARRIQAELAKSLNTGALTGECVPPLDVFETDHAIEVVVDLPGVDPSAIRILGKGPLLLIAGIKTPRRVRGEASFQLVERGYGRFARTIRFNKPCDPSRASARLVRGELRVTVPRVADRRGAVISIPLSADPKLA